jgi:hypothetical protein
MKSFLKDLATAFGFGPSQEVNRAGLPVKNDSYCRREFLKLEDINVELNRKIKEAKDKSQN